MNRCSGRIGAGLNKEHLFMANSTVDGVKLCVACGEPTPDCPALDTPEDGHGWVSTGRTHTPTADTFSFKCANCGVQFTSTVVGATADDARTFATSDTGARKETKIQRYDLIPTFPLAMLAELYGRGAEKYAEHNWRLGMAWSLHYSAAQRHMNAFWGGEDRDEETKVLHVINAAWHMFALANAFIEQPDRDDRWKGQPNGLPPVREEAVADHRPAAGDDRPAGGDESGDDSDTAGDGIAELRLPVGSIDVMCPTCGNVPLSSYYPLIATAANNDVVVIGYYHERKDGGQCRTENH